MPRNRSAGPTIPTPEPISLEPIPAPELTSLQPIPAPEPAILKPTVIPPTNNWLTFAKPKQFSNDREAAYRLKFGEPQQGPIAETIDPSEIYRKTRSQLRKTGKTPGGRRTFKIRNIR